MTQSPRNEENGLLGRLSPVIGTEVEREQSQAEKGKQQREKETAAKYMHGITIEARARSGIASRH
jgi:hypothetical protein